MTVDAHLAREIDRCQCLSHNGQVTTAPDLQTRPPLPLAEACCTPLLREPISAGQGLEHASEVGCLAGGDRLAQERRAALVGQREWWPILEAR